MTLTYGGPDEAHPDRPERPTWHDRAAVKADVAVFMRKLKGLYPDIAWVRVLELHDDGEHVHVHVAFSRGFRDERRTRRLARLWGHGFVDATPAKWAASGGRDKARRAAAYCAKYVMKALGISSPGEHAYEVAQGHQPVMVRLRGWHRDDALMRVMAAMGGEVPASEWDSRSDPDWRGPPVVCVSW